MLTQSTLQHFDFRKTCANLKNNALRVKWHIRSRSDQREADYDKDGADNCDHFGVHVTIAQPAENGCRQSVGASIDHKHQTQNYRRQLKLKKNKNLIYFKILNEKIKLLVLGEVTKWLAGSQY